MSAEKLPTRRHEVGLPEGGIVQVGTVVQVTPGELRLLVEHAERMHYAVRKPQAGWLKDFLKNHAAVGRIMKRAIARSHAS